MGLEDNDYTKWNEQELRRAESVAGVFLEQNGNEIRETLKAKIKTLGELVNRLSQSDMTLDQRLDCFARIGEVSCALQQAAEGFFSMASEPVVARLLSDVEGRRR